MASQAPSLHIPFSLSPSPLCHHPQDPHLSIPHPTPHPPIPHPHSAEGSVSLAVVCMSMDSPLEQMPSFRLCCCLWCLGCLTCHLFPWGWFLPLNSLSGRENVPSPDTYTMQTPHFAFLGANCKNLARIFVIVCVFQGFSSLIILRNRIK